MFNERPLSINHSENAEPVDSKQDLPETRNEALDLPVSCAIISKQCISGHWSMVGPSQFYFPTTYYAIASLPGGQEKWVPITKSTFDEVKEGDEVKVSLRPWEQKEYVSQLEEVVNKATDFDSLKAGFLSFGKIYDRHQAYDIDILIETLNHIQDRDYEILTPTLSFLPDIAGLREKVLSFKGYKEQDVSTKAKPEDMSDEDLVSAYKAIQFRISSLISTRDSIEKNIEHARGAKENLQGIHDRAQVQIEDAFAVLGKYRQVIDERHLQASTLGGLDKDAK